MQSNELRLGNWLSGPEGKEQVTCIQNRQVVELGEIGYVIEDLKPIPLTEDWAKLKFDFINTKGRKGNGFDYQPETSKTNQSKYNIGNEIELVFERWSYRKTENYDWIHEDSIHIDYYGDCISLYKYEVHVLQNLYFALTGEELTIKE